VNDMECELEPPWDYQIEEEGCKGNGFLRAEAILRVKEDSK